MAKLSQVNFTHGGSRGGTNRRQLYPGGMLWGQDRTHVMFSVPDVAVSNPLYNSAPSNGDVIGVGVSWLDDVVNVPTTLQFDQTLTPIVTEEATFHLIGYDQFDQLREEDITVGPWVSANVGEFATTKYAYSRVLTATVSGVVGTPDVRISQENIGEGGLPTLSLGMPFMFDDPFLITSINASASTSGTGDKGRLIVLSGSSDLYSWDFDGLAGAQTVATIVDTDAMTVRIPNANADAHSFGYITVCLDPTRAEWKL